MTSSAPAAAGLFAPGRFAFDGVLIAGQDALCRRLGEQFRAGGARVTLAGPSPDEPGFLACDLEDAAAIAAAFAAAGDVSLLGTASRPSSGDLDQWRGDVSGALDRHFLFASEFTRRRLAAGAAGSVLMLMSSDVLKAQAADPAAVTAAHALSSLIKTLSVEWARDGVRVNGLAFGDDLVSAVNLALYLLSPYGAYITGSIAIADGPEVGAGVFI